MAEFGMNIPVCIDFDGEGKGAEESYFVIMALEKRIS